MTAPAEYSPECRPHLRLWRAVLAHVLRDYRRQWLAARKDHANPARADRVVDHARSYFRSRDGREVCSLAGLDMTQYDADRMVAQITAPGRCILDRQGGKPSHGRAAA